MKFSWEWICDHIKLDMTAHEAADLLSLHGLTVDEVIVVDDDVVFDVDITTNRPDAMNIRGIARELSAITGVSMESLDANYHETVKRVQDFANIDIQDAELCHRFCARVIRNTRNGPSPEWMRKRLERVGMRSIDLNVDITNYVLWELGHPLHGYDLSTIPGGKIIVRRAEAGEKLLLLDGIERKLSEDDLVIADTSQAIGLAGVMGGDATEIKPGTTDILLECAWFDPVSVRRTSKKLGLKTEASYRYERGMDHEDIPDVIDRTCHLYQKLAEAEICKEMIDEYPTDPAAIVLTMNQSDLIAFAGKDVPRERVGKIFSSLDFEAEFRETFWKVTIPSRRVDISCEADLYEEIIRIVGYDNFPSTIPHVEVAEDFHDPLAGIIEDGHGAMLSCGCTEVINYDFIDFDDNAFFAPQGAGKPFKISNPIAAPQWTTMRQSLVPSFIGTLRHNANLGNTGLRLYEIASVFHRIGGKPSEPTILGIAMDCREPEPNWPDREYATDLFDIKGLIERLFTRIGLSGIIYSQGSTDFLAPWARADISVSNGNGQLLNIGWFGQLSDEAQNRFDLPNMVFLAQVNLDLVLEARRSQRKYYRLSKYPAATRDMSLLLRSEGESNITYAAIKEAIEKLNIAELSDIRLIDLYSGDETGGNASMTIRVRYQSMGKTMTVDEVEAMHTLVKRAIEDLGIQFR